MTDSRVKLKKSAVPGKTPLAADLQHGEIAINYADGRLFYKDINNNIDIIKSAASGASAEVGLNPPAAPSPGLLWYDRRSGSLKIYYADDNSSQWVTVYTGVALPNDTRDSAVDFPATPTLNQLYTQSGKTWKWDSSSWTPYNLVELNMLASNTIDYINDTSIVNAILLG